MILRAIKSHFKIIILLLTVLSTLFFYAHPLYSAEVIILGDTKLKPVSEVLDGIGETLPYKTVVMSSSEVEGTLENTVRQEGAKAVVALGTDAVSISQSLPESIPVIYGLVIKKFETKRRNITGVYMETPVEIYLALIEKNFPDIKSVAVVCEHNSRKPLELPAISPQVIICSAKTPYEFIEGINSLGTDVDALILLPERDLITSKTLEHIYLFSFKEKIPIIGISEKYVKSGSLLSLGFNTTDMGRQIGKLTKRVVDRGSAAGIPHVPPDKFNLYINRKTAEVMSIAIPPDLSSRANKVYP